jgi:hypothetical protein
LEVLSINAGGRFNSMQQRHSLVSTIDDIAPRWGVAMVQEADAQLASRLSDNTLQAHEDAPYHTLRWWPGVGSFPLAIIIHKRARSHVQDCRTRGRAGVVVLSRHPIKPGARLLGTDAIVIAGVHAKTGDDIVTLLHDLKELLKATPPGATILIVGDWNLDVKRLLGSTPQTATPPPSREHRHHNSLDEDNWLALSAFAQASKLRYSLAASMTGTSQFQGIWPLATPFSRIPRGDQARTSSPSWIDWGLASHGLECPARISWHDVPADHAWVIWEIQLQFRRKPKRPQTTWRCADEEKFMRHVAAMPIDLTTPVTAVKSLRARMVSHEDRSTAAVRRANREPWHVKQLRLFMHAASTERERHFIHNKLMKARWAHFKTLAEHGAALRVARGGVVARKQHLWPLQSVIITEEPLQVTQSLPHCLALGAECLQRKWGGSAPHRAELLESLFHEKQVHFSEAETLRAVYECKKKAKLDHCGLCSQALSLAMLTQASQWATFFTRLANDATWLQCITVKGPLKAKAPGAVRPENTRTILPQPVLLQVLHNLLCGKMRDRMRSRFKDIGCTSCIMGGVAGHQVLDLVQPLQIFTELALDNGSTWSAASADIKQFYDMIPPESIVHSMVLHGFHPSIAAFAARLHVTPTVIVEAELDQIPISCRVRGLLTGSRSAALLAQLPLADCFSRIPDVIYCD